MIFKESIGSRIFNIVNYITLTVFSIITFFPFLYIISMSFSPASEVMKNRFIIFPKGFSLDAYRYIFSGKAIYTGLLVSVFFTITATFINLFLTSITAYPLAHKNLVARKFIMLMVTFTLMFNGGIIPTYIVVQKLGMLNSFSSVLIPTAINAFSLIIFKNFFQQLPEELKESAKIDGGNDLRILVSIILPLSMPLIATFATIFSVGHWNAWFHFILYIDDYNKWPVQVILRQIISASYGAIGDITTFDDKQFYAPPPQTVAMCVVTIVTVPIICVYPFFQKYFTKGILLGSVKG